MKLGTILGLAALATAIASPAIAQAPAPERGAYFTRWEGRWYEVARLPNWPQRNCERDIAATLLRRTDGNISIITQCRGAENLWNVQVGEGVFEEAPTPQTLGARFTSLWYTAPPFTWGDYYALALDLDARYAILGSTDRDHVWILTQTRTIDDATYQRAIAQIAQLGYDTSKLVRTGK
jgi:apolipoprotein D and lipocalin family protein